MSDLKYPFKHPEYLDRMSDYYKSFRDGKLIGFIKATTDAKNYKHRYYVAPVKDNDDERVSPVFLMPASVINSNCIFLSDDEHAKLYHWVKSKYGGSSRMEKRPNYDEALAKIVSKPYMLVFMGCDDGHLAMRFTTEQEACEFVALLDTFDDLYDFEVDILYIN